MQSFMRSFLKKYCASYISSLKAWTYYYNSKKYLLETYYAECFRIAISGSPWLLRQSFMPTGWALDFLGLYHCFRILEKMQPSKIVEFGVGESTKLFAQYADYHECVQFYTFEHNKIWLDFFCQSFPNKDNNYVIVERPLETISFRGTQTLRYSGSIGEYTGDNIEFVLLDGPHGSRYKYSRTQILDLVPDYLNKDKFCIVIHDYHRAGEKNTAKVIMEKLDTAKIAYKTQDYFAVCGIRIIVSDSLGFLTL